MAWALQFDGVNDYLNLDTPVYLQDGESLDFNIIQDNSSGYEMWASTWESNPSFNDGEWYFGKLNTSDGRLTLYNRFTTVRNNSNAGVLVVGEDATFTLERIGNTLRVLKNGAQVIAPLNFDAGHLDLYPIKKLMKENESGNSFCFTGKLKSATLGVRHNWDATASNHGTGQPVVVDTIGNNDAQGFNFPTDGSAWIDLGGGGSTDYPTTLESGSITYSGSSISATQVINTTIASGSLSLTGQPISNPITFNSVLQSGDIALTGQSITVTSILNSTLESGSLLLTGQSITTDYIPAPSETSTILGSGSITLDGQSIQATQQINTLLDSGSISLTGSPLLFGQVTETVLGTGELTLIGDTLTTTVNSGIILETGQLTLNGQSITVTSSNDVIQTIQSVTVSYAPNLITTKYAQDTITARYKD